MNEIVYFYIEEFRNIQNQGFNFGSEYEYYTEVINNVLVVNRRKNNLYIPDFFQTKNSHSIMNISAFVGENGAGKSNFIEALKSALTQDRDWFDFIIVYKVSNEEVYCRASENIKVKYNFDPQDSMPEALTEVIYYSPALDNKIYPIISNKNAWIDISTDWLIFKDSEEQNETKPRLSQMELFNAEEIERQLKLIDDSDFVTFLNEKINVPSEIRMVSMAGDFPIMINTTNSIVRNVPYNYREYYDQLQRKSEVTDQYYSEKEYKLNIEQKIPAVINPYTSKKCFAIFLDHLLKNMFYHFELTNAYLNEGSIAISLDDFEELKYEDAVYTFIKNIDIIDDSSAIISFVDAVKVLIENGKAEFHNFGEISWIAPKDKYKSFIKLKDGYLNQLKKFLSYYEIPRSFIGYSWRGISTGEKALLNLFSRFYFAKSQIQEKVNPEKNTPQKTPDMLYILIDEGELGFHLQWQKEYVYNIIEFLPKSLMFGYADKKYYPNIQIIFTTHSTLTLSDIPSSHISYIQNRDNKAYVLNSEEKPRKSFGANVHSLMSDSFFLREGLVGSFAIAKINEIIKILNAGNPFIEGFEKVKKVIKIIDEPILKTKLQSMLNKIENSNEYEIKRLEIQKEEIENRINKLKGND